MLTVRMPFAITWLALSLANLSPQLQFPPSPPVGTPSQTAHRTVTGSVVNSVTGEPIRRALVRFNGPEQRAGFTGADGRFEVTNLPDGSFQVTAQKPGFLLPDARAGNAYTFTAPITIGPGTGDVQLKLAPQSSIEGRATGSDGEPLEGMAIQAMVSTVVNGRKQWQQVQNAQTDEDGRYRIENLTAGSYVIKTASQSANNSWDASGSQRGDFYPAQFYPNSQDAGSAQPLQLQPGQTGEADFTLKTVASYSASGLITGVRQGVGSMCIDDGGEITGGGLRFDTRTARFTVMQLPPGACTLHFESRDTDGQQAYVADLPIQIESSDLKGLRVELRPATSMLIHVSGASEKQASVQVQLTSTTRLSRPAPSTFGQPNDGQHPLELKGIEPDTYIVSVHFFGQGCVGSVLSGGQDLLRNNLTIAPSATPPPIEITIRDDCATLSGSIKGASPEQPVTGSLILVPDNSAEPQVMPVQPNGNFDFANLTPGAYRLFAFSNIDGLEYANPESLRSFDSDAVTLGPNEKATTQVSLIARGGP